MLSWSSSSRSSSSPRLDGSSGSARSATSRKKLAGSALAHRFRLTRSAQLLCGVLADRFEHRQSRFRSADASWTRLFSRATRGSSTSRSPSQTASAASIVQPPANTASRENKHCWTGESRSWLQASAFRSVCCRSGWSRGPSTRSPSRSSSRTSSAVGANTAACAAASSIASGSPSRRHQARSRPPCRAPLHGRARGRPPWRDRETTLSPRRRRASAPDRGARRRAEAARGSSRAASARVLPRPARRATERTRAGARVVQHEQHPAVLQVVGEQRFGRASTRFGQVESASDSGDDERWIRQRSECYERVAIADAGPRSGAQARARGGFSLHRRGRRASRCAHPPEAAACLPAPARPRVRGAVSAAEAAFPRARPGGRGSGRARGCAPLEGDAARKPGSRPRSSSARRARWYASSASAWRPHR